MTREDLFLAIGAVESSRLERTELTVQEPSEPKEEPVMKKERVNVARIVRNLIAAAIIISMLGITAYAVVGYVIFDSPEEMIDSVFGDQTGYDHSKGGAKYFNDGGLAAIEPTFDRVSADKNVVAKDIVPHVDIAGQSISWGGYTLTVDAFMYDSTTRCGFVTYLLENPNGLPEYKLQSTGEIWYDGVPNIVSVNQYGYPYIIQEKTTDTCLAVTYYFKLRESRGENLEITLRSQQRYTPDEFAAMIEDDIVKLKREMIPQEAVETVRQRMGDEEFEWAFQGLTEAEITEQCYTDIAARQASERLEAEGTSEPICISLSEEQPLNYITAGKGSSVVTPISIRIDITNLDFLHTDPYGNHRIHADNIDSVVIRYKDGTEYTVIDGYVLNYAFAIIELPYENVQTEVFVSPEEDPDGEGYFYVENSQDYCLSTMMFNRIIDVDKVASVVINGVELAIDEK